MEAAIAAALVYCALLLLLCDQHSAPASPAVPLLPAGTFIKPIPKSLFGLPIVKAEEEEGDEVKEADEEEEEEEEEEPIRVIVVVEPAVRLLLAYSWLAGCMSSAGALPRHQKGVQVW